MGFIRMGFVRIYRPECVCMCLRELVFVCLRACVIHVRTLSERARHRYKNPQLKTKPDYAADLHSLDRVLAKHLALTLARV